MRDRYDFADSKPNPYAKRMKRQVTIRLDEDTITYFKAMADRKGLPKCMRARQLPEPRPPCAS